METLEARGTWAADRRKAMRLSPAAAEGLEALRPEVSRVCGSSPRDCSNPSRREFLLVVIFCTTCSMLFCPSFRVSSEGE